MGRRRRKVWGQNFLSNEKAADRIVSLFGPDEEDTVLEIGPGGGVLTRRLAPFVGRVVAVEIDPELCPSLREEFSGVDNVSIVEGDILELDLADLLEGAGPVRIISNLPYSISTAVLVKIADMRESVADATLMVQREVAERILSPPGRKAYGSLSVLVQIHFEVEKWMELSPGSFRPVPKVRSTVVHLEPKKACPVEPEREESFRSLLKGCFSRRRKKLITSLTGLSGLDRGILSSALRRRGIDPDRRPEEFPPSAFVDILHVLGGLETGLESN